MFSDSFVDIILYSYFKYKNNILWMLVLFFMVIIRDYEVILEEMLIERVEGYFLEMEFDWSF